MLYYIITYNQLFTCMRPILHTSTYYFYLGGGGGHHLYCIQETEFFFLGGGGGGVGTVGVVQTRIVC